MRPGSVDDVAGLADDLAALEPQDEWYVERPEPQYVLSPADYKGTEYETVDPVVYDSTWVPWKAAESSPPSASNE